MNSDPLLRQFDYGISLCTVCLNFGLADPLDLTYDENAMAGSLTQTRFSLPLF